MSDSIQRLLAAADFAAGKHKAQVRKGLLPEPYINHPIEVARLLSSVGRIEDVDVLIAAILHDTVEDTDTSLSEISGMFGEKVAAIVAEVTDEKNLPKTERKRLQVVHAPGLSEEAKLVKLADKISNIDDIITNPPEGWDKSRKLEYVQWGKDVIAGLTGANPQLETMFAELAERAIREIESE